MVSSIILIILQLMGILKPETDMSFMKIYLPVCLIEVVAYFIVLSKLGDKE